VNSRQRLHALFVGQRRARVLAERLSQLLPSRASVLDLGCGDGRVAQRLCQLRPDLDLRGMDVQQRPAAAISVARFDGRNIPLGAGALDFVLLCDVLHHTRDLAGLLAEARRVARRGVVVKDHVAESRFDHALLALMDAAGNPASVAQPHHYLSEAEWRLLWERVGLRQTGPLLRTLGLYPQPFDHVFGRGLHFVTRLEPRA
jgi:SAM-dependent methyltransferase